MILGMLLPGSGVSQADAAGVEGGVPGGTEWVEGVHDFQFDAMCREAVRQIGHLHCCQGKYAGA